MNWADERYVRVYTRDSDSWLVLSWIARALLVFMFRKADRAGVIETKRGARGVAALVGMPVESVETALPELLEDGCIVAHERGYVVPNFIEAQEANQSDALRAKEYRARRRDKAMGIVTKGDAVKTKRDGRVTPRDGSSRASRTPSLLASCADPAVPALAVPQLERRAAAGTDLSAATPTAEPVGWRPPVGGRAEKAASDRITAGEITADDAASCWTAFAESDASRKPNADAIAAKWIAKQRPAKESSKRGRVEPAATDDAYLEAPSWTR